MRKVIAVLHKDRPLPPELPEGNFIYLLHFSDIFGDMNTHHCRHYLGATSHLATRLRSHKRGYKDSAKLARLAFSRGDEVSLILIEEVEDPNERFALERRYKKAGHFPERLCPICMKEREILRRKL